MTEPTDVEIESAWTEATGSSILPYPDDMLAFARAVLAKWGTPAGEGEVVACGNCGGSGWMVRDPDIGTDQECFVCDGSGRYSESATPQPTKAREIERLRQDAARYRWLRHGDNDEKVLKTYTSRPSEPGEPTMFLPRNDELDRLIDAARAAPAVHASVKGAMWFTKKPVTIQAIQWTGDNLREVITFTDGPPDTRSHHAGMAWDAYRDLVARDGLKIYTLEGKMLASPGDWIIRGVKGELYPCKPDIFEATYSPAAHGIKGGQHGAE